jgi:hypothetical protein
MYSEAFVIRLVKFVLSELHIKQNLYMTDMKKIIFCGLYDGTISTSYIYKYVQGDYKLCDYIN